MSVAYSENNNLPLSIFLKDHTYEIIYRELTKEERSYKKKNIDNHIYILGMDFSTLFVKSGLFFKKYVPLSIRESGATNILHNLVTMVNSNKLYTKEGNSYKQVKAYTFVDLDVEQFIIGECFEVVYFNRWCTKNIETIKNKTLEERRVLYKLSET